jgi:hypothetical protein
VTKMQAYDVTEVVDGVISHVTVKHCGKRSSRERRSRLAFLIVDGLGVCRVNAWAPPVSGCGLKGPREKME